MFGFSILESSKEIGFPLWTQILTLSLRRLLDLWRSPQTTNRLETLGDLQEKLGEAITKGRKAAGDHVADIWQPSSLEVTGKSWLSWCYTFRFRKLFVDQFSVCANTVVYFQAWWAGFHWLSSVVKMLVWSSWVKIFWVWLCRVVFCYPDLQILNGCFCSQVEREE